MLDRDLSEQLKSYFQGLGHSIELVADRADHPQQQELLEMLGAVAATSESISFRLGDAPAAIPSFAIHRDGAPTGIRFHGIPGGHEFSSLVLAILNAAGKGRLPDDGLARRIRRLPAGATIHTYISLSCDNCPDVVQALNQIALVHGEIEHVMIDGGLVQSELQRLKIQGVPSVMVGDELVHAGRATMVQLIERLEARLGTTETAAPTDTDLGHYDVAVIGGGPAGVSAAIYSARKGLRTALLAEKIGGQLQETKGIENLISVIYTEGPALAANLLEHLGAYPVDVLEHRRVATLTDDAAANRRTLRLDSGEHLTAEAVIVATGARWRQLGVPGEVEHIGRGVAFCPHCDGPLYKGKKVAVVGGGNSGVEAAIDLAGIASEVVLLEFMEALKADSVLVDKLSSLPNVRVITSARTTEVVGDGDKVVALRYADRETDGEHQLDLDGVFVQIGLSPNSDVVKGLVETTRWGEIVVDGKGRTSVSGIYAAGDVTTVPYKQIIIAMGEGAKVALTAFEDRMRRAPAVLPAVPVKEQPDLTAA